MEIGLGDERHSASTDVNADALGALLVGSPITDDMNWHGNRGPLLPAFIGLQIIAAATRGTGIRNVTVFIHIRNTSAILETHLSRKKAMAATSLRVSLRRP